MTPTQNRARRASTPAVLLIAAVVLLIGYALDQYTKHLVVAHLHEYERVWVIPGLLKWYYIRNSGAAFSLGEGHTWIFTLFMSVVAAGVIVFLLTRVRSRIWALALGGLLAGTLGNLTDRLFRAPGGGLGHVVDFISVGSFAIFNVADSLIVCSVIGIVILLWRGVRVDGTRPAEAGEGADTEVPDAAGPGSAGGSGSVGEAGPADEPGPAPEPGPRA